ncbi:aldose 1-epimerase family protein [Bombilactobacillus folatiphilus]|uniref:Aldose 1-epimerase family protein n=1 Tax=Bombilactobacillus folatiphilus TaxID=2923362 RepID=A0ABY4PB66_9LACO|nr:aldose 1-epimerase family protein [Bombilactobacillus folatiphilus]UQS82794.1 aldose 1-epimerase family protein [Bombilactobacillus folatiphilus]
MTVITLKNADLTVQIDSLGAQILSILDQTATERIWTADPKIWGRHAPILFPIVGRLKDNQYQYKNRVYQMNQHGFARDLEFQVLSHNARAVTFELKVAPHSIDNYPFSFSLQIAFVLKNNGLQVNYSVQNLDQQAMYFSVGGHPGFMFAYQQSGAQLVIKHPENLRQFALNTANLVDLTTRQQPQAKIYFHGTSFEKDAWIFENRGLNSYELWQNNCKKVSLTSNAPYFGVWSPYPQTADFVCLEPWWGIADVASTSGQLVDKFGINILQPQQVFNAQWSVEFD